MAGASVWAGSALAAGVLFHDAIDRLLDALARLGGGALVLLVALLALYLLAKWHERRRFYKRLRMSRIRPEELRERLRAASPLVILDVRARSQQLRDPKRIPGALMLTPDEIERKLRDLDRDQEIVLYCT